MFVAQLCPTPCDHMNCSLPGSSVHGIIQAIILEWATVSFSKRATKEAHYKEQSFIVSTERELVNRR